MALLSISPGNSPEFTLTPSPRGVITSIDQIGWAVETDDPNTFDLTMTANADDATGMTATLSIPQDIPIGATITLWCVYRRQDGGEVLGGPWDFTVTS